MDMQQAHLGATRGVRRRDVLKTGLVAGAALSTWSLQSPSALWGAEAGQPKRGGILRVRGYDPPHFDHHLTINFKTNTTLSFAYSTLVRYKVGPEVRPGTFTVEPHLAERWEAARRHHLCFPSAQRRQMAQQTTPQWPRTGGEDVKFTYDRFLTEPGNPDRYMLELCGPRRGGGPLYGEVPPQRALCLAGQRAGQPSQHLDHRPEVVQQFGDLKKPESVIGTGPFILERYEPNVKTVFKRNPDYFLKDQPYVDGVEWLVLEDESTGLAMYRTGQIDAGPWHWWVVRQADLEALQKKSS